MSSDQQQQQHEQPQSSENQNGEPKMMTQAEYLKYKQQDSNQTNYYGFCRDVDVKPVAWVKNLIKMFL